MKMDKPKPQCDLNKRKLQCDRDRDYLVAISIVRNLHAKGVVTESELVRIAAILADRFSASEVAKTLNLACL